MTGAGESVRIPVTLPAGAIEVSAAWDHVPGANAVVAIAHGAGAGHRHPFLEGFARGLGADGYSTLRFDFAYREAGRRMPGPASHAVAAWRGVADWLEQHAPGHALWAAGKSYGGRMASMAAAEGAIAPDGLVYLGYPLHPPGRPDQPRDAHLPAIAAPQLFVEGANDPFVDPHEQLERVVASCQDATLHWIDGGGHSFEVKGRKRPADEIGEGLASMVGEWIRARS